MRSTKFSVADGWIDIRGSQTVFCFADASHYRSDHNSSFLFAPIVSETVIGVIGYRTELECDIQPTAINDQLLLVLWYKDGHNSPIYTWVVTRNRRSTLSFEVQVEESQHELELKGSSCG